MSKSGYIYILSNPAMPGIVYINATGMLGAHEAAFDLWMKSKDALPFSFDVEFAIRSDDIERHRSQIEIDLIRSRINRCPEFFRFSVAEAIVSAVSIVIGTNSTRQME